MTIVNALKCAYCDASFPSKNKLFQHLRNSSCTALAAADGLEIKRPTERVALVLGIACRNWQLPLLKALDVARGAPACAPSYEAQGAVPGVFASERDAKDMPKACDVLSLTTEIVQPEECASWCAKVNAALPEDIRIFGRFGPLPADFHAERSCMRRYFTCLLPTKLLIVEHLEDRASPNGYVEGSMEDATRSDLKRAIFPAPEARRKHAKKQHQAGWGSGDDGEERLGQFFRLKEILREFQGEHLFHNFSQQALKPSDTLARRFVYRCRAVPGEAVGLTVAVDSLAPGQLRAMAGLAIALQRQLLPDSYLEAAFSEEQLLTVPMVPEGTEYQAQCVFRKDFHHLLQPFFESEEAISFRKKVEDKISREVLDQIFQTWFDEKLVPLTRTLSADFCKQGPAEQKMLGEVPGKYADVLRLLREAEQSGKWPACSKGREKVMKLSAEGTHGSFTVGSMPASLEAPNGTKLFPELALRCFELEDILKPGRCSSTIAINKRAQFLPHIDSGAGAGQGISLIVGLGDYTGGELCVEDEVHDIRYKPLEFNGWTQRHWTKPFEGERFSLVWFTPAGCEDSPGLELMQKLLKAPSSSPTSLASLANGLQLPRLGMGTWQLSDKDGTGHSSCEMAVQAALEAGCRLFDTASIYKNEAAVGRALQNWKGEGVFITSKCSPYEMGYEKTQEACRNSLQRLGLSQLDLYLIHWPALPKKPHTSPLHRKARHETWKAMEQLYRQNLVRAIGVSNFTAKHLQQLIEDGVDVLPMVNQIEVHPLYQPRETIEFCRKHSIIIEAYSPLGGGSASNAAKASEGELDGTRLLLSEPAVRRVAAETGKSSAQVLLRWAIQQDFMVIPRSSKVERIRENFDVFDFELSEEQMRIISEVGDSAQKFCWDPKGVS